MLELTSALLPEIQQREAFDPQFTEADVAALKECEIDICQRNEECRRRLELPSLVFMPHLEVN